MRERKQRNGGGEVDVYRGAKPGGGAKLRGVRRQYDLVKEGELVQTKEREKEEREKEAENEPRRGSETRGRSHAGRRGSGKVLGRLSPAQFRQTQSATPSAIEVEREVTEREKRTLLVPTIPYHVQRAHRNRVQQRAA